MVDLHEKPARRWRKRQWAKLVFLITAPVVLPLTALILIALWPGLSLNWRIRGWHLDRSHNETGFDELTLGYRNVVIGDWQWNGSWDLANPQRGFDLQTDGRRLGFLPLSASIVWESKLKAHRVGLRWMFPKR